MKQYLLFTIGFIFTFSQLYGKGIDEAAAKKVAVSFISSISGTPQLKSGNDLQLVYKPVAQNALKSSSNSGPEQAAYFYVFSSNKTNSFVIVSGDDRALPVLGYSTTSAFDPGNIPPNMQTWLEGYEKEIQYALENNIKANVETATRWDNLLQGEHVKNVEVVSPMIQTQWAQSPYYNDLCPYDNESGKRTVVGCHATAMAQIMKYWNYPAKGKGSHSYIPKNHPELGIISADFENTQYNWSLMPNTISAPNSEIAKLMFHCGVSVDMDYGVEDSWARPVHYNHPSILLAFRDNFGYKHINKYVRKSSYQHYEWINLIKEDINNQRPVLYFADYSEEGDKNGHAFVCDGYDSNNYFHFNWGWGGLANGYFASDAIIIMDVINLTYDQGAVIQLEPLTTNPTFDIRINSKVNIQPSNYLSVEQPFSIATKFKNCGALEYEGVVIAILMDNKGNALDLIGSEKAISLDSGASTNELSFSTNEIAVAPGNYFITFFALLPDNSFKFIDNSITRTAYYNFLQVIVADNNNITSDEFEENDFETSAYELTPDFTDNSATFNLQANIHNLSDIDHYKIKFPAGYDYQISSLLNDCGGVPNSAFDGKYAFKSETDSWSFPEDVMIPEFVHQGNDDYLYFKVEPFLSGYLGLYELSFDITRQEKTATQTEAIAEDLTTIYPVPNDGSFTLKLRTDNVGENKITIYNINGQVITKKVVINSFETLQQFDLEIPPGIYFVWINNKNNYSTKKIIVTK